MKTLFIPAALFVLTGIGIAQPPTAPAPRPVGSNVASLTFTYDGPEAPKTPKLEMQSRNGKVEVRWTLRGESCLVIAPRATVNGDVASFAGTEQDPVVVSATRANGVKSTLTGTYFEIVLSEGKMKVAGTGAVKLPR